MSNFKFGGKHPAKHDHRTLQFKNYATGSLPAPPEKHDNLEIVYKNLHIDDPLKLFPSDGNNKLGDCTCAAVAHALTVFNGLVGKKKIWNKDRVEKFYFQMTGGKDTGLQALDVLKQWRTTGADNEKIFSFVKIDHTNHTHVKQAIHLLGGVYLGIILQENTVPLFESRKTWHPDKPTKEGHAMFATSYDHEGVTLLTWGDTQKGTWAWWDSCVDEAYIILPPEAKKENFHKGFDFDQLMKDLNVVAS